MEFRNLYYFLQVCDDKSFSAAAARLYITQQPLSKSVKALEKELGSELFEKNGNSIQLTTYGKAIYPICRDMVRNFEAGIKKIRSVTPDGASPVRLTTAYQAADTLSFTLIEDFHREHAGIRIHCDALPDLPAEKAVLDGEADFVLGIGIPQPRIQFDSRLIRALPLCIMVGPGHPLYPREILRMSDLDGLTLHCAGPQFKTYHLLQKKAADAGITLHLIPTSGHLYTTYQNVFARGRAVIGIYGSQGEPELADARQIPFEDPDLNWDIYFSCRQDYQRSPAEDVFFNYILSFAGKENS